VEVVVSQSEDETNYADALGQLYAEELAEEPEDDPIGFSLTDAVRNIPGRDEIALEESKNLAKLEDAFQGISDGTLSDEAYRAAIEEVALTVDSAVELYDSDYIKYQMATMEPQASEVFRRMGEAAQEMQSGLARMLQYLESRDLKDAEAGLNKVAAGLVKVDKAQDVALARAAELEYEEEQASAELT
jgi:antitoxin component HigA of HigAB toxin-antitoxin module